MSWSPEILVDPHSPFWALHEEVDPWGDPLVLMLLAEQMEEEGETDVSELSA